MFGKQRDGAAAEVGKKLRACIRIHQRPAVKRIDEYIFALAGVLDQEVERHSNSLQLQAYAVSDLDIKDRKGDRYASAPLDNLVQVAVARIEIVGGVAGEPEFIKEYGVDGKQRGSGFGGLIHPGRHLAAYRVDLLAIYSEIQIWVPIGSYGQRRLKEVYAGLATRNDF